MMIRPLSEDCLELLPEGEKQTANELMGIESTECVVEEVFVKKKTRYVSQGIHITSFKLSRLGEGDLPSTLANLKFCKKIKIIDEQLSELPDSIKYLENVEELSIDCPSLDSLPEWLEKFTKLRHLMIYRANIEEIPPFIGGFKQLTNLHISHARISRIPDQVGGLKQLKSLHLTEHQISGIPEALSNIKGLEFLNLASNEIFELPSDFKQLKRLVCVDLANNKFAYIGKDLAELPNLVDLNLNNNFISDASNIVSGFDTLFYIQLAHNSLKAVPDFILWKKKWGLIDLSNNKIDGVPDLADMEIDRLDLCQNPIQFIHAGCLKAKKIKTLGIDRYCGTEVPVVFIKWAKEIEEMFPAKGPFFQYHGMVKHSFDVKGFLDLLHDPNLTLTFEDVMHPELGNYLNCILTDIEKSNPKTKNQQIFQIFAYYRFSHDLHGETLLM